MWLGPFFVFKQRITLGEMPSLRLTSAGFVLAGQSPLDQSRQHRRVTEQPA